MDLLKAYTLAGARGEFLIKKGEQILYPALSPFVPPSQAQMIYCIDTRGKTSYFPLFDLEIVAVFKDFDQARSFMSTRLVQDKNSTFSFSLRVSDRLFDKGRRPEEKDVSLFISEYKKALRGAMSFFHCDAFLYHHRQSFDFRFVDLEHIKECILSLDPDPYVKKHIKRLAHALYFSELLARDFLSLWEDHVLNFGQDTGVLKHSIFDEKVLFDVEPPF